MTLTKLGEIFDSPEAEDRGKAIRFILAGVFTVSMLKSWSIRDCVKMALAAADELIDKA